jgi:hypothetical protein
MGRKKDTVFPVNSDVGNDFEDEDFILNWHPKIEFVQPEPELVMPSEVEPELEPETIDTIRDRTQKAVNGFDAVTKLADLAQKRIDNRVAATGGLTMKLNPAQDAATIAAIKRRFPKKEDPTLLTYDDYKQVLECVRKSAIEPPTVTASDIHAAKADPYRTNFGGLNNQQGENRAEVASSANSIQPLDLSKFQQGAVLALFALLLPLVLKEIKVEILQHLVTAPHNPI